MEIPPPNRTKDESIQLAKDILSGLGIELRVSACGCCNSPDVYLKYKDEVILNYEDCNLNFTSLSTDPNDYLSTW